MISHYRSARFAVSDAILLDGVKVYCFVFDECAMAIRMSMGTSSTCMQGFLPFCRMFSVYSSGMAVALSQISSLAHYYSSILTVLVEISF